MKDDGLRLKRQIITVQTLYSCTHRQKKRKMKDDGLRLKRQIITVQTR
jgi:hypothetical protein